MPLKSGKLTPRERAFRDHYAASGDAAYAATRAGLKGNPAAAGWAQLQKPAINEEVRAIQEAELYNELRPLAQRKLRGLLESEKTGEKTLLAAIKLVMDKTGIVPAGVSSDMSVSDPVAFRQAVMDALGRVTLQLEADENGVFG